VHRRTYLSLAGTAVGGALAGCTGRRLGGGTDDDSTSGDDDPTATAYRVETVATGLERPWGLAHLPDDARLLVTERVGRLLLVDRADGSAVEVEGTPSVDARGQGGLLDVALHPDYPDEPWTYLTYAGRRADGASTTHLGRGRLRADEGRLEGFEVLYVAEPFVDSSGHFGSRVAFDSEGSLFVTVGDRQFKDFGPEHVAQDLGNDLGTTLRLRPDGSIPSDNPFVDDPDARDAIYSYGHRNAQGLAVQPGTGAVWESEFGERGGDELNRIERGGNYGWPVADEGCTYGSGEPIGVPHADRADVVAPRFSWPCGSGGFPPSGATFYDGDAFPDWRGDLLVGGLASRYLARLRVDGDEVTEAEGLLRDRGWRIRAVAVAPDTGNLHVAVDAGDAPLVRLVPA
jgi:quinoprotein glucose dehydrogenase